MRVVSVSWDSELTCCGVYSAKFRRDSHYLSDDWIAVHKPIRFHNEGIHGRLKSDELAIGNPKHRPAQGQVAQTLLVVLVVTAGHLDILETWLHRRTGTQLSDTDVEHDDRRPRHPRADRHALNGTRPDSDTAQAVDHRRPSPRTPSNRPWKRRRSRPIMKIDGISSTAPELTQERACVDLWGFEPQTPSMRTRCATGLRHRPLQRVKL